MVFGFSSFSVFNFKRGGLLTEVLCLICFLINLLQTVFSLIVVCLCARLFFHAVQWQFFLFIIIIINYILKIQFQIQLFSIIH